MRLTAIRVTYSIKSVVGYNTHIEDNGASKAYSATVHSPTDAHLLKLRLKITLKLDGSYMFRFTTIIRELAIEPG